METDELKFIEFRKVGGERMDIIFDLICEHFHFSFVFSCLSFGKIIDLSCSILRVQHLWWKLVRRDILEVLGLLSHIIIQMYILGILFGLVSEYELEDGGKGEGDEKESKMWKWDSKDDIWYDDDFRWCKDKCNPIAYFEVLISLIEYFICCLYG